VDDNIQEEIRDQLEYIIHILRLRWLLFGGILLALVLTALVEFLHWQSLDKVKVITKAAYERGLKNEAAIDAAMKQQVIYQQQLAQYMDFLDKKNPKVKVPRVIVTPPPTPIKPSPTPTETPPFILNESQLERSPGKPVATAKPSRKSTIRKKKATPSPTPKPWYKLFKTTR
jgi:hypothetical protein